MTAQRTLVVRVDLNNFTFAYTLQDKVSAIRHKPPGYIKVLPMSRHMRLPYPKVERLKVDHGTRREKPVCLGSFLLIHRLIVVVQQLPLSLERLDLDFAGGGNFFDRQFDASV